MHMLLKIETIQKYFTVFKTIANIYKKYFRF